MNYHDGQKVILGDVVRSGKQEGIVIALLAEDLYMNQNDRISYSYAKEGAVIDTSEYGPVQFEIMDEDTFLISRSFSTSPTS